MCDIMGWLSMTQKGVCLCLLEYAKKGRRLAVLPAPLAMHASQAKNMLLLKKQNTSSSFLSILYR
jgi:hypothetical protein